MATDPQADLSRLLLKEEIEEFLAAEADCLDERRFDDWLALLTEDRTFGISLLFINTCNCNA